jgi:predicted nuclease of predicted toxin-antitoxin system
VTLRLLLDENLSERLLPLLSARFEHLQHVRLLGLGGADDLEIWELARRDGYL